MRGFDAARRVVVVGCGEVLRGDDGLGVVVVRRLREELAGRGAEFAQVRLEIVEAGRDGLAVLDLLAGTEAAFVVDAIVGGATPGTVHRIEAGARRRGRFDCSVGGFSSHGILLGLALTLSDVLEPADRPKRLVIYGIEPARVSFGDGLSAAVSTALPELERRLRREVEGVVAKWMAQTARLATMFSEDLP